MFVYRCNASWPISKMFRRYVKMRVSDKHKRKYQRIKRLRRQWFWHETSWNRRHGINEINNN